MPKNNSESKKLNLGIELLRFFLCFWVVIFHCSNFKKQHSKYIWRAFHVPTFFVISFYFFYPILFKKMIDKNISRFHRLLIPYLLWPILLLIMDNFMKKIFLGHIDMKVSLKKLFLQILFGDGIHGVFWFHFSLIFISLLFSINAFLLKNHFLYVLQILGLICLYLLFSEFNYKFFNLTSFKSSLGTIVELMPLAVIGCIYSSFNLLALATKTHVFYKFILFIFIIFLFEYDIFILPKGFRYPNVILFILASTILILFFGSLYFSINIIYSIIRIITKYTGGIYYIHFIIRNYLQRYVLLFKKRTYFSASLIYFISYGICFLGSSLFRNQKLEYLFL